MVIARSLVHRAFVDCEHLIRHMLVVEPDKRYGLKQILDHRWMLCQSASTIDDYSELLAQSCEQTATLDTIVVNNMLQLPNLTFDEIAESVHNKLFNHIYAIYNLLVDKLQAKRREQKRLQHHASLAYSKYVCEPPTCSPSPSAVIYNKNPPFFCSPET